MNTFRAEIVKLFTLRTPLVLTVLAMLGTTLAVGVFTASVRHAIETDGPYAFNGVVDASSAIWAIFGFANFSVILLGSWAMYQEHGTGNLRTAVLVVPGRVRLFLTKSAVVFCVSSVMAIVAVLGSYCTRFLVLGQYSPLLPDKTTDMRAILGVVLYWALLGTLTFAVSAIARNGLVGMGIMLLLTLALSQYLERLTDLAKFLPDRAGVRMYEAQTAGELGPGLGLIVLCAWVALAMIGGALSIRTWAVRD